MENEREKSEYNTAFDKNGRINEILWGINQCRHTLDIKQQLFYLKDLYMELIAIMPKQEKENITKRLYILSDQISEHTQIQHTVKRKGVSVSIPLSISNGLEYLEILLRQELKNAGLDIKKQKGLSGGFDV